MVREIHSELAPEEKSEFLQLVQAARALLRIAGGCLRGDAGGRHAADADERHASSFGLPPISRMQMQYLRFIYERVVANGIYPSVGLFAKRFDLKPSYVATYLRPLVRLGYLAHPVRGAWVLTEHALKALKIGHPTEYTVTGPENPARRSESRPAAPSSHR